MEKAKLLYSPSLEPTVDPGKDGTTAGIAKDVFGFVLNYFSGDYNPIGGGASGFINPVPSNETASAYDMGDQGLFNGNIKQMTVGLLR